jgi:hypothetical protein
VLGGNRLLSAKSGHSATSLAILKAALPTRQGIGQYHSLEPGPFRGKHVRYVKVSTTAFFASLALSGIAHAWISKDWRTQTLMEESALVVVAEPRGETVIASKQHFPHASDPNVYVDDVATTFEVILVVKGSVNGKTVLLHHQRFSKGSSPMVSGPSLIEFKIGGGQRYLLFLNRESNGNAVATSGLFDQSAIVAIK